MVIISFILCVIFFMVVSFSLAATLWKTPFVRNSLSTFLHGFKEGLKGSGLKSSARAYPVELWVWETMDDHEVCEDCLERASWPPMDIADWMKEGLPRTSESETQCGHHCRCQIVPFKKQVKT